MKKIIPFFIFLGMPFFVYANPTTNLIAKIGGWIDSLIPLAVSVALLYFIWGIALFIRNAGDSTAREEGKQHMMWGIVGLFVIISVWGLVLFLNATLDIQNESELVPPSVNRGL